jgi:aryl-alcohol dehydrogenase-like predicted oxidoreductase
MEERRLGETGLTVTTMGLGLAALGRPGYINLGRDEDLSTDRSLETMRDRAHAVLDAAWAAGIRYVDAARSYGRAEEFVARWLERRDIPPDALTLGSKWGYTYTAGWRVDADVHEVKDHSQGVLRRQWAESRGMLGRHLDLYQIHSATLESGVLRDTSVLRDLVRMRNEEGVRIGLSLSGPGQGEVLGRAVDVEVDGERVFEAVQATWNLLEPSAGPALAAASRAGMGIIVKESLANGRLAGRDESRAFADKRAILFSEARRLGTSPDALALSAALQQPWATTVLSGATLPEQLHSNITAIRVEWDDLAKERLATLAEEPPVYWRTRSDLGWR